MGKKYIVGDTGAGYAGKMLSMAAKKFGLKCKIFMGAKDIKRQKPNCDAMRRNGAEIVPVYSGSQTLVDAVSECMRYWVSNCDNTHMCVGSTVGPNIFVKICGWSTAQISRELKIQLKKEFKKIPNKIKLINCVGGGSSAYGFWSEFIDYDKKHIELIGVEAGGPKKSKLHAAPLSRNAKIGILHGAASYVCQNNEGQIQDTESISAGLDYPGVSPIHCFLKDTKRARYTYATDEAALNAEAIAIGDAIDGIADNIKFNGKQLVGAATSISIGINDAGDSASVGTATSITVTNTDQITGASGVDGSADTALGLIAKSLGNVAAGMVSLKGYQAVASNTAANLKAAAARIQDTDYALETANLTKAAILNQSAMAMVAQANQAQQAILTVIQ